MSAPGLPWRVPAALCVTQLIHWGSLFYAFSVLMPALIAETGWAREAVVGAFSAGLLAEAAAAIPIGVLLDRIGARRVMVAGSVAAAAGLFLAGKVAAPWQLYAVWIGLGATMAAVLYQAAFAAVTAAFGREARRGIAVVAFVGGLASTVFWPVTGWLVDAVGWRGTCTALALLNLACAVPHALLPRASGRKAATGAPVPADGPALGWRFAGLAFVYAVIGAASAAIAVHLVPFLQERGLGASAALLASLVGVAQVAGRVAEFAAGGRLSVPAATLLALGTQAAAFALLGLGWGAPLLGLAVALYGAANGVLTIMRGALPVHLFGTARYGTISGALSSANALARAAGPLAVAWAWGVAGGYAPAFLALAALAIAGMVVFAAVASRRPVAPP
ncbi:MFS transporter [Pararoseomonas indoligenes]|uniref:MFS transporter n=1 Tax=Roseomonas indoligenes TaxID=2820811 RepID=A0A940S971_9PROT|nr:MFS transporter [Pararoseomonas indoligenes]MBP0494847.1 MFS transporter [Pararoseomonas indoligenes]